MSSLFPITSSQPWLAPLAGFSDLPFRLLCRELGASVACTEMISAKGLVFQSKGTKDLLATCPEDAPLVVQIFGSEPPYIAKAMDILLDEGFRYFDLNCGCSVKKVVKTGSGAALLKTPKRLAELVSIMAHKAGTAHVGVKIRLGWHTENPVYLDLAAQLEQAGAAWITLHPRSAKQGFSGTARWDCLAELKKRVNIPVIASGDLFTVRDACSCIRQTGVDAVMFARGALNNPAIFKDFQKHMQEDFSRNVQYQGQQQEQEHLPFQTPEELVSIIHRFMALSRTHGSETRALLRMRTLAPRFIRAFPGSRSLRTYLTTCRTWEEFAQGIQRLQQSS